MVAPPDDQLRSVAILGHGLAAWLAAAVLKARLPETVSISMIGGETDAISDALYGSVLPPEAYDLHLSIGLDERVLMKRSNTAFCFGTHYQPFGPKGRAWTQAFHQPLPAISGVPLELLLAQSDIPLEHVLISASVGERGCFAHPPQYASHPLSRAEYGYVFAPHELAELYKSLSTGVKTYTSPIEDVGAAGETIRAIRLKTGDTVEADLFVDATGPSGLRPRNNNDVQVQSIHVARQSSGESLPSLTQVTGHEWGWRSESVSRTTRTLILSGTDIPDTSLSKVNETISFSDEDRTPWRGNLVSIGSAAGPIAPLTLAPIRRLLRGVVRLGEMFPVSRNMETEARAYNRAAADDHRHSRIFQSAFFSDDAHFGRDGLKSRELDDPKLLRKLRQYDARGYHVSYDHEPFDRLEWAMVHAGMGRKPRRSDPLAASVDQSAVRAEIQQMRQRIASVVSQMPPHKVYVEKLMEYLDRKGVGDV